MTFRATAIAAAFAVLVGITARAQDDAAKLSEAGKKASEWTSVKFKIEAKVEGGQGKDRGPTEGTYEKGKGIYVKADKFEAIKAGDKTVVKGKDGSWAAPGGGDTPPDPNGGDKKKKGMGGKGPGVEDPLEALANLDKKFSKVTSAADGENTVFSGDLTPEGAADLMGALVKRFASKGETKGTAKITVDKNGNILKIEVDGTVAAKVKDKDINLTIHRTTTFSDVNTAKLEIPDEAKKALGQP